MARHLKLAFPLAAAIAVFSGAVPVRAQGTTTSVYKAKKLHTEGTKPTKARYEVLHMMTTGIQVRSLVNELEIRTFTYSDQIHDRMMQLLDQGGYQYGDKVEIEFQPGTQVALKIKGKPSKPI